MNDICGCCSTKIDPGFDEHCPVCDRWTCFECMTEDVRGISDRCRKCYEEKEQLKIATWNEIMHRVENVKLVYKDDMEVRRLYTLIETYNTM